MSFTAQQISSPLSASNLLFYDVKSLKKMNPIPEPFLSSELKAPSWTKKFYEVIQRNEKISRDSQSDHNTNQQPEYFEALDNRTE
jgi:hypothetical protein